MQGATPDEELTQLLATGTGMPPTVVNERLLRAWPLLHGPLSRYERAHLVALFRHAGYVTDDTAFPHGALTIYRGEPATAEELGISWTRDREVAIKYARDYATMGATRVLQASALPGSVMACFAFEAEVVVDPDLLEGVTVFGSFPHFKNPLLG